MPKSTSGGKASRPAPAARDALKRKGRGAGRASRGGPRPEQLLVVLPLGPAAVRPARAVRRILARLPQARVLILDERRRAIPESDELPQGPRVTRVACRGRGLELAHIDGLRYADRHGFTAVITLEVDGRIDPRALWPLADSLGSGDLILGVRGPHHRRSWFDPRSWPVRFIRLATKLFLGRRLADPTTPFRLYGRAAIELLSAPPHEQRESFQLASLLRIMRAGLEVREVAIPTIRRRAIRSVFQGGIVLLRLRRSPAP